MSLTADIQHDLPDLSTLGGTYTSNYVFTVQYSGYYFIQVWGGDGGNGGTVIGDKGTSIGGAGGNGAYLEGYIYLERGDALKWGIASNGASQDTVTSNNASGGAGIHGGFSTMKLVKVGTESTINLVKAGGGGGGGAAWRYDGWANSGKAGMTGESAYNADTQTGTLADSYNEDDDAGDGETEYPGLFSTNAEGGGAGSSYINGNYINQPKTGDTFTFTDTNNFYAFTQNTNDSGGMVKITCLQLDEVDLSDAMDIVDYSFAAQMTQYFVIDSVSVYDDKFADSPTAYDLADVVSGNMVFISDIDPQTDTVTETAADGTERDVLSASFRVDIVFAPKAEFAGGNQVPVLQYGSELSAAQGGTTNSTAMDFGMILRQPDTTQVVQYINIVVPNQVTTDFANVAVNKALINDIGATDDLDRTIEQSENINPDGVPMGNMYKWDSTNVITDDTDENYWKYEFVNIVETITLKGDDTDLSDLDKLLPDPLKSTLYTVTVGLEPKNKMPSATVVAPVEAELKTAEVEIIVQPRIHYVLENLTTSDFPADYAGDYYFAVESGADHTATLTPNAGYDLPQSITVVSQGNDISELVNYDASTGVFTIPEDRLVGTIEVTASANPKAYTITFYYQTIPNKITVSTALGGAFAAGTALNSSNVTVPTVTDYSSQGYEFIWDWGSGKKEMPKTMPFNNLTVIGTYVPQEYTLTVHYQDVQGNKLAESTIQTVRYTDTYTITAPDITGYVANTPTVTGEMPNGDDEVTITYTANAGLVTVITQYSNGKVATESKSYAISTGSADYAHTVSAVAGYSYTITDVDGDTYTEISGTATQDQITSGLTFYVTYTPNTYELTFDANGGSVAAPAYAVEYDNQFGYNAGTGKNTGLPTPVRTGYTFDGWYTAAEGGEKIENGDTVTVTADTSLYAHWSQLTYKVTVRYKDQDGNHVGDTADIDTTMAYGTPYSYTAPDIDGYISPEVASYSGYVTKDLEIEFVYTIKIYTLTIKTVDPFGEPVGDGSYSVTVKHGEAYTGGVPTINGYTCVAGAENIAGPYYADTEVTLVYAKTDTVYVTVTWGEMVFDYTQRTNWDGEDHTYDIPPLTEGTNWVTVTNQTYSACDVNATVSFTAQDGYVMSAGFTRTKDDEQVTETITDTIAISGSGTYWLWLRGSLTEEQAETQTQVVGQCTVTISIPQGGTN